MSRFQRGEGVVSKVSLKPVEPPSAAAPPKPTKGVLVPKNSAKPPKPTKGKKNASVMQESSMSKSFGSAFRGKASDLAYNWHTGRAMRNTDGLSKNPLVTSPEERAQWLAEMAESRKAIAAQGADMRAAAHLGEHKNKYVGAAGAAGAAGLTSVAGYGAGKRRKKKNNAQVPKNFSWGVYRDKPVSKSFGEDYRVGRAFSITDELSKNPEISTAADRAEWVDEAANHKKKLAAKGRGTRFAHHLGMQRNKYVGAAGLAGAAGIGAAYGYAANNKRRMNNAQKSLKFKPKEVTLVYRRKPEPSPVSKSLDFDAVESAGGVAGLVFPPRY